MNAPAAAPAASPLTPPEVTRVVLGLLLAMFLAAIDQTIVAVALVSIGRDLGDFDLLPWIVSGYLVASAVSTPVYGKLSDLYGRRRLLSIAIAIFFAASVLCALAQSMPQLILFRVLQGLGGGGLLALSQATVADIAPGPERGRYQGYLSGVFAAAAVAGPVLGGYLTYYISWRAIFWLTVPLATAAFLISRRAMARLPVRGVKRPVDYPGAILLAIGLTTVLIALTRIGQGYGWTAPSTLLLAGVGSLGLLLCALRERVAPEPILPPELFTNRTVLLCCAVSVLVFFVLVGYSVLLPIWMQALGGARTDDVALRMLPLTLTVPTGAFIGGRTILRTAHCRPIMLLGAIVAAIGTVALAVVPVDAYALGALAMGTVGLGIGLTLPSAIVDLQSAVPPEQMGIATAVSALFRTLGGAIGIAILTSVLFAQVRTSRGTAPGAALGSLTDVGAEILHAGFQSAFVVGVVAALLAVVVAFLVPERSLLNPRTDTPGTPHGPSIPSSERGSR